MFNFGKKKEVDYVEKLIDQQGDILKIVEDQRAVIKQLQETVKTLTAQVSKKEL